MFYQNGLSDTSEVSKKRIARVCSIIFTFRARPDRVRPRRVVRMMAIFTGCPRKNAQNATIRIDTPHRLLRLFISHQLSSSKKLKTKSNHLSAVIDNSTLLLQALLVRDWRRHVGFPPATSAVDSEGRGDDQPHPGTVDLRELLGQWRWRCFHFSLIRTSPLLCTPNRFN